MEFNLKTTLLAYPQVGTLPVGGIQEVYLDETTWELVFKMVDGTLVKASLEKGIELITQEATDRATENIKRDITPLIDKLREDLIAEINRATSKEEELNNSIITLSDNLQKEIARAIAAEQNLHQEIVDETQRATTRENELEELIGSRESSILSKLQEEVNRAIGRENELDNKISDTNSTVAKLDADLNFEIRRATAADFELTANLNKEIQDRKDAITNEQTLREQEDVKINKRIDDLTTHTDTSIQELDTKLTNALNVERQERISADTLLTDNLNKEIVDRTDAINNEKKLREDADKVLTDNLNKEIEDRQNAITQLDNSFTQKLNEEISNRELAITNLDNKLTSAIEKETQARQTADNTLTTNLNKEIQDREKAITDLDTKLTTSLNAEVTAREEADNALTERVTNEVSTLNSTISALDTKLTNAITKETADRIEDVNNARQEATTKIEEEKHARELADNNLAKSLEKEKVDRTTADNDLSRRVDNLEGKTTRLFYGEGTLTSPNATEIQAFIDGLEVDPPYTAPYSGVAIVVHITSEDTYHIWHYYDNLKAWRDDGIDTVSTFTNTTRGIIQGSDKAGYISASDGFGKVNGWEELNNKVSKEITDRENAINNLNQTLSTAINEEARVRQEQDTNLTNLINQEKTDRQEVDTTLTEKINKEITDRETADTNIINDELRFSKSRTTTVAVGGIPKGTTFTNEKLLNIINNMFFPYVAFSISGFATTPNGGVYECGQTINVTNSNTAVTLGSENIKSVIVYDGQTKLGEKVGDFNASSFAIPITSTVTTNKNFKVEVKDDRTTLTRNSAAFTFVYPYYYGSIPKDTIPTQELVKGLTKVVQTKGNKTYKYTHSDACSVIAYPTSYGDLRLIKDQNNFDITSSFTKHTLSIVGLDKKEVSYNVYVSTNSSVSNFGITFNY